MSGSVRVGTRRSALARAQTELIVRALSRVTPGATFEVVPLATDGDRTRATSGPLDFTDAIDRALERREVDLAVHSAKDLPARLRPSVGIAAVPRREDPRDCLVLRRPGRLADLPDGARVGSSSVRRRAQLARARPDLEVVELRGNVDSRIARVRAGEIDGAVLAVAGIRRLGRSEDIAEVLPTRRFLPAPGQGALAVTIRVEDRRMRRLVAPLDHSPSHRAVVAERAFSEAVGGDCTVPLAALARVRGRSLSLRAELFGPEGELRWHGAAVGPATSARRLGVRLGRSARRHGPMAPPLRSGP